MIEVLAPGPLTTVQDLGRPGLAHLGVPRSGALDQPALALANRLVGNPPEAAGLEITLSGCTLRATVATSIAVTGAYGQVTVDGREVGFGAAARVPAGATVQIGRTRHGLRTYLAVAGGIDVPPVLGSRSTDTLSGLGPAVLCKGDLLPLGTPPLGTPPPGTPPPIVARGGHAEPSGVGGEPPAQVSTVEVRVVAGPRADWFAESSLDGLAYRVSPHSNRVGVRLTGPVLTRVRAGELPSEGMVLGAVQVPADGQPVIFLADHPTTGGYPVIAVVHPADLPLLAQARPGTTVEFRAGTAPG